MNAAVHARTMVLVVGAPRSGTTWLHRMLAAHPQVAALPEEELTVISRYAATWLRNYRNEERDLREGRWRQGMPVIMTEAELDAHVQPVVDDVYARVLARNPAASHIVDKHPNYANHLPVADRYLPNCKVVHIIRDGREVAVSMMSANERLGHSPGEVRPAAKEWHRCITNAQAYGAQLGAQRYLEVRYEELLSGTAEGLSRVFAFCGLSDEGGLAARIAGELRIDRKPSGRGDQRNNALRHMPGAIWRNRLTLAQRHTFDRSAGALLHRLGYAAPGWWALGPLDRLRMLPRGLLVRGKRSLLALRDIWTQPVDERLP